MRYLINLLAVLLLVLIIVGCSSRSEKSPILPPGSVTGSVNESLNSPDPDNVMDTEIQSPLYSNLAQNNTKDDASGILYAGALELDAESGTITNTMDRDPMINLNVTGYLFSGGCAGGCFRFIINSIVDEVWDIDVTIENPTSIQAYDVRLIFTDIGNKTIENLDGYSDLFDPPGVPYINPFIAFMKGSILRPFPNWPGGFDTQKVLLKWPAGDPPIIKYVVTASLPNNTEEPYTIYDFAQIGELYWNGGNCNLGVSVKDWQWDITAVKVDTTRFNNQILFLVGSPEQPEKYEVNVVNENNVPGGTYPVLFKAESPNLQNASMYNIFDVIVTGSPQTEPVCDFYIDPDQIAGGQTTWLYPGPGIYDPDGDDIVLYEFDFDYDGAFEVMASNPTGDPVESPPAPDPGPNPVDITMALRITDNGIPPLSSICTDIVTVVLNAAPVCELVLSDYEVNSGASVDCWPGPGTNDPDGSIVLYEYDFDYDGITFDVEESNTTGDPVATGPIDNTSPDPITLTIAMRVADDGTPAATDICTAELTVNPILVSQNPWRTPGVRVTPYNMEWASVRRDVMEGNLVVYGDNVYVAYHGQTDGREDFFIQRSTDGGVTFNPPQSFGYPINCSGNEWVDYIAMDILANGWVSVATFSYSDNCYLRGGPRWTLCKPNASGGVDMDPPLQFSTTRFSVQNGHGFMAVDVSAHPTDPDVCWINIIDLDGIGGGDPDDTSTWKVTNITTSPAVSGEFAVIEPLARAPAESGLDKAHMDSVCDYNGNLHVVLCSRDLGTLYYIMVYGNTPFYFDKTDYVRINLYGETYPEGAHVAVDRDNNVYIAYAATGIPGEIEPQEIGMLTGVGYPPTFPDPPIILNHDREGDQVFPDIEFDQTTGDLWVAYTTGAYGPGQITFELYDYDNGWTRFEPDYFINKDDPNNEHNDENVHLFFDSTNGTAYAIWEETDGPNSPHIYFNRTN